MFACAINERMVRKSDYPLGRFGAVRFAVFFLMELCTRVVHVA
jgi:hypothetical protein